MEHTVKLHIENKIREIKVASGANLLGVLREQGVAVESPCGGNGRCGKCKVRVSGLNNEPAEKERNLLGEKALASGYRLACYNQVRSDLEVFAEKVSETANIQTAGKDRATVLQPLMAKTYVELPEPNLEDQTSDLERVLMACGSGISPEVDFALVRELPALLRSSGYKVTLVVAGGKLVGVEKGDTTSVFYGVAVDIGTTTIAAYLYDLCTGKRLGVHSMLNPQRKFGADVLSRIEYTMASTDHLSEMHETISQCMNAIVAHLTQNQGITPFDVYEMVFAGNTTMMHFLLHADARYIAASPFIPVTTRLHRIQAGSLGISINDGGMAVVFPCVSGYIGADTVAAVLSSGMYTDEHISLLIDIGTNGEIVLGNKDWLYSCSTAAGPAFEGANIRNGVGGIRGAIDKVTLTPEFRYTTIGQVKPLGICGSGIVDAIAQMLNAGVLDETGRLADEEEAEALPSQYGSRIMDIGKMRAFVLADASETGTGSEIAVTQKDVRELQNAKAAIAAGIRTLAKRAGISLEKIDKVYLAGGFGSYINIDSALRIGLLPQELAGRIESIGNAAGSGAVEGLLSSERLDAAVQIKSRIRYIELSASADFVDEYVECMLFE